MPANTSTRDRRAMIVLACHSRADRETALRGEAPRADFDEMAQLLNARVVTAKDFDASATGMLGTRLAKSPAWAAAYAALAESAEADHIYLASEDIAFRLVPLLALHGWHGKVHAVIHACHSWRRQILMRLVGHRLFGSFLTDTSTQADYLIRAGVPAEKVHVYVHPVDTAFFNPARADVANGDYVFSCGLENRDYETLEAAARLSPRQFRVQASGYFPNTSADRGGLPPNFELNKTRLPYTALRDLYAASRVVVVPLNDVPYAAGVTGLIEAMALGKPVIVTASAGIRDYTQISSLVTVPPNDPAQIAAEIERLWAAPELCRELGAANHAWARANGRIDDYARWTAQLMGLKTAA